SAADVGKPTQSMGNPRMSAQRRGSAFFSIPLPFPFLTVKPRSRPPRAHDRPFRRVSRRGAMEATGHAPATARDFQRREYLQYFLRKMQKDGGGAWTRGSPFP